MSKNSIKFKWCDRTWIQPGDLIYLYSCTESKSSPWSYQLSTLYKGWGGGNVRGRGRDYAAEVGNNVKCCTRCAEVQKTVRLLSALIMYTGRQSRLDAHWGGDS